MRHTPILPVILVLVALISLTTTASAAGFSVSKTLSGSEPFPINATLRSSINITNSQPVNITTMQLTDNYDPSKMNFSSASIPPDSINYASGILTWNNISTSIGNLSQGQSYILYVNFTPVGQGIGYNNASVTSIYSNTTQEHTNSLVRLTIGDNYENDNTYTSAKTILTDGTEQYHTFQNSSSGSQDFDWVKFNAVPGHYYIIQTQNYSNIAYTDTYIYLYASDGTTLLQENDDIDWGLIRTSKIVWLADSAGPYYVKIKNWDSEAVGGNYSISVEKQGHLALTLINPSTDSNVSPNRFFNLTARLSCINGACRDISFTLDPEQLKDDQDKLHHQEDIEADLEEDGKVDVIITIKDEDIENLEVLPEQYQQVIKEASREYKQEEVIAENPVKVKQRYRSTMNGFSAQVDRSGLQDLLEDDEITGIYYDRPVTPFISASVPFINADDVWSQQVNGINLDGCDQTVCIIDSGINYNHADFGGYGSFPNAKVIGGYDFANNDDNPFDEGGACAGHGSHVAGIIASEDSTYKGVAPGARIVALKVLEVSGSKCVGSTSDIIAAIDWCVANASRFNISVISMSLGTDSFGPNLPCDSESEAASINAAVQAGLTVIVASGNEYRGYSALPGISSPACVSDA
ncbi:TPA: S8 family serine peptidase, partial [Candidatus Woesearchaeota archaeon]|nr:S8 family serine peptidase [Candidatus Woesearchaeota archaeon]